MKGLKLFCMQMLVLLVMKSTVFCHDLVLRMDEECEKLSRYQMAGSSAFWKVSLKKDMFLSVGFREVGNQEVNRIRKVIFSLKESPEFFFITKTSNGMLRLGVISKGRNDDDPIASSVYKYFNVNYKEFPKLIQLSENSEIRLPLYSSLSGQFTGRVLNADGSPLMQNAPESSSEIEKINYDLVLAINSK
jgi:hypothetical protein